MLQTTVNRCTYIPGARKPIVVGSEKHSHLIEEQVGNQVTVIAEPHPRNTAPAIALAAFEIYFSDPSSVLLVLPADHVIQNGSNFRQCVRLAVEYASNNHLVTFGIIPTKPETGYGYIKLGEELPNAHRVDAFVEKPNKETAIEFLNSGNYVWNSGMFAFKASKYLSELKKHCPDIYDAMEEYFYSKTPDKFEHCPSESIDYAVMQKSEDVVVIPSDIGWSDVGSWDSVWELSTKDKNGNTPTDAYLESVTNSYVNVVSDVAVIGLDNVAVIEVDGKLLVMNMDYAQTTKNAAKKYC